MGNVGTSQQEAVAAGQVQELEIEAGLEAPTPIACQ